MTLKEAEKPNIAFLIEYVKHIIEIHALFICYMNFLRDLRTICLFKHLLRLP
jgi:hypothetical protein